MNRVFLSYARDTLPLAQSIAGDLSRLDWQVWFDQELSGGQSWWDSILEQIRSADVVLAVISQQALESEACKLEILYARALKRQILPVLVSTDVEIALLPSYLAEVQFVDRRNDSKGAILDLLWALKRLPAPPSLPVPLPESPRAPVSHLGRLKEDIEDSSDLSRSAQWDLIGRLKAALRENSSRKNVISLVRRMKVRSDLLAVVAEELNQIERDFDEFDSTNPKRPSRAKAKVALLEGSPSSDKKRSKGSEPRPEWEIAARAAFADGDKVTALRTIRAAKDCGLNEAKELLESWTTGQR